MNYSINIYDALNPEAATIFENAEAKTLILKWNGSDNKMETIIGSDLSFTMEVTDFQDGFFSHLNTYDERRYSVELINEDTNALLWKGHLLPDQYDEPYTNGAFFVNFSATCGLGSLQGQFLAGDYYEREKSIIDFVSSCLSLTGVPFNINITPAISNKVKPRWDEQFLDGKKFVDGDKKDDAYSILEKILFPLHSIHQSGGAWYIYGHNKKNASNVSYQSYSIDGTFIDNISVVKGVNNRTFLNIPTIRTHTPRKNITLSYPIETDQLSKELTVVKNDGYTLFNNNQNFVNHLWQYSNSYFNAKYSTGDGKVFIAPLNPSYSSVHYIQLREELFIFKGIKVKWEIAITTSYSGTEEYLNTIETMVLDGLWSKIFLYDIYYTDPLTNTEVLLHSNKNGSDPDNIRFQIPIGTDRKGTLAIEILAPKTAYYNIRIYRPVGNVFNIKTDKIWLDKIEATVLDDLTEATYTSVIKNFYSQSIDETITMHDDIRDVGNMIRLSKLGDVGDVYDTIIFFDVATLATDTAKMIRLSLDGLKTVLAHKSNITVGGEPLRITGFEYNYLGSDEFYAIYDEVAFGREVSPGENVVVSLRKFAGLPSDIEEWTKWADDIHRVDFKRYALAAIDVLRNLYTKSHPLLFAQMRGFLTPRDFVNFNYQGDKVWYPLDVEWRLDEGDTVIIASQNFYGQAVTQNLPPSVNAGVDITLANGVFSTTLTAVASDPDGSIVSIIWDRINPSGASVTITHPNSLVTDVTGLIGDEYIFRVTVTDNVGLTASDTVTVSRSNNYTLVLTSLADISTDDTFKQLQQKQVSFSIDPPLTADQTARITINATMLRETPADIAGLNPTNLFTVSNNVLVASYFNQVGLRTAVFLYRTGNSSDMNIVASAFNSASDAIYPDNTGRVFAKVQADITAEIITGKPGVFTNLPIQLTVEARK